MTPVKEKPAPVAAAPAPVIVPANNGKQATKPPILEGDEKIGNLDERLYRLDQLFELRAKYNRLKASEQRLKTFLFEKEDEYSGLTIRDDKRNEFFTGNPEVCAEIVKFMQQTISKKIAEIEPLLKW